MALSSEPSASVREVLSEECLAQLWSPHGPHLVRSLPLALGRLLSFPSEAMVLLPPELASNLEWRICQASCQLSADLPGHHFSLLMTPPSGLVDLQSEEQLLLCFVFSHHVVW